MFGEKGQSEEKRLNGNIKGNAFERNRYDCFSVNYDTDVGEVYKIQIHTDMMYAGAGWKCDYFRISTKKIDRHTSGGSGLTPPPNSTRFQPPGAIPGGAV